MALFSRTAVSVTKGAICSAARAYSSYMLLGSSGSVPKSACGDGVLLVAGVLDVRAQQRGVQQVDDAQAAAVHLVFIRRADAAAGGADLRAAGGVLRGELDHAVVGQDHLGAVGDEELAVDRQAGVLQLLHFAQEGHGVEHDAVADDALAAAGAGRRRG